MSDNLIFNKRYIEDNILFLINKPDIVRIGIFQQFSSKLMLYKGLLNFVFQIHTFSHFIYSAAL